MLRWTALLWLLASGPVVAQDAGPQAPAAQASDKSQPSKTDPATVEPEVTVEARRAVERKSINRYVNEITVRTDGQIARFHDPICPAVVGLPNKYADVVRRRIIAVAQKVGLTIDAKPSCHANFLLVVSTDMTGFIHDARTHWPGWFGGMDTADIDRLERSTAVARAWSATSVRDERGQDVGYGGVLTTHTASLITELTAQYIDASFVILDRDATYGLTLTQLADYAVMRGLAQTQVPTTDAGIGTILGLFEKAGDSHPRELTRTDLTYLQALYKEKGYVKGVLERNRLAAELARQR